MLLGSGAWLHSAPLNEPWGALGWCSHHGTESWAGRLEQHHPEPRVAATAGINLGWQSSRIFSGKGKWGSSKRSMPQIFPSVGCLEWSFWEELF